MNRIFISHSSKDTTAAKQVLAWLKRENINAFLDSDLELGIKAGADWNEELRIRLEECSLFIPICSQHFRASDWCRYEVDVAYHRSIDIIPILIDNSEPISILTRFQTIQLGEDQEDARQRLIAGVKRILDSQNPLHWDPQRRPYPGLDPFLEADEAIFFGRQREINEGIQTLRSLRREKEAALLMVIGSSGSGKSSLVRAGILPRIKREPEEWIVLDPFRPGREPFRELATGLANHFARLEQHLERSELFADLQRAPLETLSERCADLRLLTNQPDATLLICIDQFEEVLEAHSSGQSSSPVNQRQAFVDALKKVISSQVYRDKLLVIGTLRSDFLDVFQAQGMTYKEYILRPLEEENFRQVIVEPARLIGLKIEPELVDMIIDDTKTGDALPLLAFTLRELWEKQRDKKLTGMQGPSITRTDYFEIGRLEGAIQKRAEDIFRQYCLPNQEADCRDAFLQMIRSNADMEQVGWVKQAAPWNTMPPQSLETLNTFVTARLLVKKTRDEEILIEPAHEALLRNWSRLREWIKEENDFLLWRDRFHSDVLHWQKSSVRSKDYLSGAKLIEAERWKDKFSPQSMERLFINKSILHRKRIKQIKVGGVMLLILLLLASLNLWQNAEEAQAEQLKIRQLTSIDSDPYESGIAGLAAMGRFFLRPGLNYQITRGLERILAINLARSDRLNTSLSRIDAIVQLADDRLIIAGIQGAHAYVLEIKIDADGSLSMVSKTKAPQQTSIRQLLAANDGKTAFSLGYSDDQIFLTSWPKGEQQEIFKSLQIDRQTLAFIPGNEVIVTAYGEADGNLYFWSGGEVIQTLSGVPRTTALITLDDGTLVSAHESGPVRKWKLTRKEGKAHAIAIGTLTTNGLISSLTSLRSKDQTILIAGGQDGSLHLWKNDKEIQRIDRNATAQDQILSLTSLPTGEVVSGDRQSRVRWWKWQQEAGDQGRLQPVMHQPFPTGQGAIHRLTVLSRSQGASRGVISTGGDGSLRLLSIQPYPLANPLSIAGETSDTDVTALAHLGQDRLLVSSHQNGAICWWDLPARLPPQLTPSCKSLPSPSWATALLVTARDGRLLSAGSDGRLHAWNPLRQEGVRVGQEGGAPISPINAMIPSGRAEILTGHEDGTLRWTSLADSTSHERWVEAGMRPVVGLVSLAQQSVVVAGGAPGTESLRWWRGPTPLSGQGVAIPHDRLTSMVRWKGHQLVTGGSEGSLQLWTHGKPDGDLLRTDHNTGVWSLITLRGNLVHGPVLLTGGDDGTIRIWASDIRHADPNSQADHESFETGQSRVTKLMENSFGDLISGSSDGTIKVLSPRRIVRAACQHYAPLLNNPNTTPEKEAAQLCTCQIPDSWWEFWSWLCFGWNMFR